MNELSLFTGIGGGLLGSKLLGWKTIGAVEWGKYPCRVLEQRQKDGCLEPFPIWNIDIREFNKRHAEQYRGVANIITAGFPCQPFSVAGKRAGADDERNMWPATIECIRIVKPRFAFLENVPGLLSSGYFGTILRDLAESGYDCKWRCLSAAEVGANTRRNRLFILGIDNSFNGKHLQFHKRTSSKIKLWQRTIQTNLSDVETSQLMANGLGVRKRPDVTKIMEPIKAIGNGQVPLCMAVAYEILSKGDY